MNVKNVLKKCKKAICMTLVLCFIFSATSFPASAMENAISDEDYQLMIEREIAADIERLGLNVIAEHHYKVPVTLTNELIDNNKDLLTSEEITSGVIIVNVTWLISYTAADGLAFYTTAYGDGALLKSMSGMNYWQSPGNGSGAAEIRSTNTIPMSRISNYISTSKWLPSGATVNCNMYVDINAYNEISGGYFSASDVCTVP